MFGHFITFCDLVHLIDTEPKNHSDSHPVENVEAQGNKINTYIGKK